MSGFTLFYTSADEAVKGNESCRNPASHWKSMRAGEITGDASGRNYVTMAHDEVSKNHPGSLKDTSSTEKYARMYETDSPNDGYKAVKLYLSKLNPKSSAIFQYPSRTFRSRVDNKPLGINIT